MSKDELIEAIAARLKNCDKIFVQAVYSTIKRMIETRH